MNSKEEACNKMLADYLVRFMAYVLGADDAIDQCRYFYSWSHFQLEVSAKGGTNLPNKKLYDTWLEYMLERYQKTLWLKLSWVKKFKDMEQEIRTKGTSLGTFQAFFKNEHFPSSSRITPATNDKILMVPGL